MSLLFESGLAGPHVDTFRERVRGVVSREIVPLVGPAEKAGLFPRDAYLRLAAAGLVRERWSPPPSGDAGRAVLVAEELARAGCGGVAVGISLCMETVAAALTRYGRSALATRALQDVLAGRSLGCFGASEPTGGSDLNAVRSTAVRVEGGWRVRGEKKFLSLARVADFALLLCRVHEPGTATGGGIGEASGDGMGAGMAAGMGAGIGGGIVPLGIVLVPTRDLAVVKPLNKLGTASLDTTWMAYDTVVGDEAMLGRPGLGLAVTSWALSHERLAIAAQVVGIADRAIGLAAAHLHRRRQFGTALIGHQALRLRLAQLAAELTVLRYAVYGAAAAAPAGGCGIRQTAALKVTAVRFAERAISECMHLFGGSGYLEDETPLARMWRDVRLGRLGGGSDEMMWELVAAGMVPDFPAYDAEVVSS